MHTRPWPTFWSPRGTHDSDRAQRLRAFVHDHVQQVEPLATAEADCWRELREAGSELWLDVADLDEAGAAWSGDFRGVTTNNSLLAAEVQRGNYDRLAAEAAALLRREDRDLEAPELLGEVAFVLNAAHGLTIARRLGATVSVELHTSLADDEEGSYHYGRRLAAIAPEQFVIKVPLTPAGLVAARRLAADDVRVSVTLGFSPRQNLLIANYAKPEFTNVFVGRIEQLFPEAPFDVGVAAAGVSQRAVHASAVDSGVGEPVRQIAASLRSPEQLAHLAGIDVLTMPASLARKFAEQPVALDGRSPEPSDEEVATLRGVGAAVFVEIGDAEAVAARQLDLRADGSMDGERVRALLQDHGVADLFPQLRPQDLARLDEDGKIPDWTYWRRHVVEGTVSWDGLLNVAGLLRFAADQARLDTHIARLL